MEPDTNDPVVASFMNLFVGMTVEQRSEAMGLLGEDYCMECYGAHPPHGFCQCWNDE